MRGLFQKQLFCQSYATEWKVFCAVDQEELRGFHNISLLKKRYPKIVPENCLDSNREMWAQRCLRCQ